MLICHIDMPTAHNSPIYRDEPAQFVDAAPIITLRAAGALIFGKTTTTEFASTVDGGPSTNPHDSTRTPGGSSSGSGAAVGDFQVPIALGTQTGGSTIRPGSFNGIFGFKPTWGSISREGLAQYSMTCDTLGLYARSVQDLELLSSVFQLADDEPIPSTPFPIKGSRIAFLKTHVWPKAGPGTKAAWEKAKELLSKEGASVEEIELPEEFAKITDWHAAVLAGEGRTSFLGSELSGIILETEKCSQKHLDYLLAKEKMHPMLHGHVENHTKLSRKAQLDAYDGCAKLRPVWDEIASKHDVIFTPSVVDEAPVGIGGTGDAVSSFLLSLLGGMLISNSRFAPSGKFSKCPVLISLGLLARTDCRSG